MTLVERKAFHAAIHEASRFRGATSPNPPVGAAALGDSNDESGEILAIEAHEEAGTAHAEAKLLSKLSEAELSRLRTLFITLEPCNHQGRTPPCTEAILRAFAAHPHFKVVYAVRDPNPKVAGAGASRLRASGVPVRCLEETDPHDPLTYECQRLIAPFTKWVLHGIPWVTVKTVWNAQGTMIPPPGQKTFSSPESLKLAHELRKRADAIITGSGTVISDSPEFTVRYVADHQLKSPKKRILSFFDRRKLVPKSWYEGRKQQGFEIVEPPAGVHFPDFLRVLGGLGVLEVLIEAGPELSGWILESGFWDEHVRISDTEGTRDIFNV
jgi:diaminohydroxyphosphoribosylaminopyrimidine deaminase/5-amino-6-(5-phosphoribosylamino)uracil reductase